MNKNLTIIVPTYNEEQYISSCIKSILSNDLSYGSYYIFIIDGGSKDNTIDEAIKSMGDFKDYKIFHNINKTAPYAMNLGILKSETKYIARADAHAEYPPNYFSTLLKHFDPGILGNIGTSIKTVAKYENKNSTAIAESMSIPLGVGNSKFRTGSKVPIYVDTVPFGFFEREFLQEIGGYDERLEKSQDIELNHRILRNGKKILLLPQPQIIYFARTTFRDIFKKYVSNARWNIYLPIITNTFKSLSFRNYAPTIAFLTFLCILLLSLIKINLVFILLMLFMTYFLLVVVGVLYYKKRRSSWWRLFFAIMLLHFSHGFGGMIGLLTIRKAFVLKNRKSSQIK